MMMPQVEEGLHQCLETVPILKTLGFRSLECDVGFVRVVVPRSDRHNGLHPTFHGGIMTTVADCAAWLAIATKLGADNRLTTSDIHVRFLSPCFTDVTAEARVIKFGRTLCPVDVKLFDANKTQVATAQVTYFRLATAPQEEEEHA
ncbi:MAG: PaaI family thioesterase [Planctomycetota bacterium]|nr:PaaI family thioesterase [Planctomycetota bacterium]